MLENSRRLAELKWIVPVDFVWTADLRWHYINWWKTRKQRIRDENVTTDGSSWWYSTIYLMLKIIQSFSPTGVLAIIKRATRNKIKNDWLKKSGLLKKYPSLLKTFNNGLDLQKWMKRSFRKRYWSKQAYRLHNCYQIPNLPFLRLI